MESNIDMSVIMEALNRRAAGATGSAGMTPTTGETPTGGANTPVPQQQAPANIPMPQKQIAPALKSSSQAQSPQFDDDTRMAAKVLMQKLLKTF